MQSSHRRTLYIPLAVAAAVLVAAGCGASPAHDRSAPAAEPGGRAVSASPETSTASPDTSTAPPATGPVAPSASTDAATPPVGASASAPPKPAPPTTRAPAATKPASPTSPVPRSTAPAAATLAPKATTAAGGPVGANPTVAGNRPSTQAVSEAEAMSLELLNVERARVGLAPVRMKTDLGDFARRWAEHMSRNAFEHSGSAVDALATGSRSGVFENIVWWSDPSMTARQAAEKFQDMWRHSPGHYRNQTVATHTEVGIGIHHDATGWWGVHEFSNG